MATMKEAIVSDGPTVEIKDSPIPKPEAFDVLIKIVVSGSNPKDWKYPEFFGKKFNSGDDIAGTIEAVGRCVTGFHKGDRVAGFHRMATGHGSFAEYGIVPADTTFHLPEWTSYEEAATIPLAAMTAALGLFVKLGLPEPWTCGRNDGARCASTATSVGPLIVYGAASAVGAFAIQLAKHAAIHPIIGVAGKGIPFVESLLDKSAGDAVVDYRQDDDAIVAGIKEAAKGAEIKYCYDAVSEKGTYVNAANAMVKGGKIALVLPGEKYKDLPTHVERFIVKVGDVHKRQTDFGAAWFGLFAKGLRDGWLKGHPVTVVPGGLTGVQEGLSNLKSGKASATKYVFRIEETDGVKH